MISDFEQRFQFNLDKDSIAVVGNAKSLFGKNLGGAIDQHNLVMRLNYGKIVDISQQGSRTDLYGCSDDKLTLSWVEHQFNPRLAIWLTNKVAPSHFFDNESIPYFMNQQRYWERAYHYVQPARPSSGAIAIALLREVVGVKNIHLYGFDFFASPTFYHRKKWFFWQKRKSIPHHGNAELEMMQKLGIIIN